MGKKPIAPEPSLLPPELSWSDHEKDQTWVPRYDEHRMETALWRYCVSRHKQRWLGTKRHRGPPTNYSEGKGIGWWFPKIWTKEFNPPKQISSNLDKPSNPEMAARVRRVFVNAASLGIGSHPFPGPKEFQRWNLPDGTVFVAADATVIYPNGAVEKWASVRSHGRKAASPEPSIPEKPLVEEIAATPSPELVASIQRKEWLAKQERGEGEPEPSGDPQAWRFEAAGG